MDQFSQTNDLQKAIDEISGGSNAATPAGDDIQVNLGEPPVPPANDFGMPPMGAEVTPPEPASDLDRITASAPEAPEIAPAPEAPAGDLNSVRESVLKELVPIIDKTGLSADRQFGIIAAVVETSHDKSFIPKALEAARAIPDEKLRAEALLKIIGLIDR
ncbi:hypothetical protein IKF27_03020 [Candidatus Saccharibacteria bacterium]|nr:hypothetical protein [Candidatus Saccharibacteria bacterium]